MKKWVRYLSIICLVLILFLGLSGFFFLNYALKPNVKPYSFESVKAQYPYIAPWLDSLQTHKALKDTFIINKEGVKLHAYYVLAKQPTPKTAVLIHGYTDNSISMFSLGYMYNQEFNYNIILPDLQYHGESEGSIIQMGWKDRLDILEWIDLAPTLLRTNPDFVLHGVSMGAATTMMVAGEKTDSNIKCFVEDCGYTSVWDEFSGEAKVRFNLPSFPILDITSWLCDVMYGWNFKEASALRAISQCHLPMLFIHGAKDTFVPTEMVYRLYDVKPKPKDLWVVPLAEHAVSYKNNREIYTEKVESFINLYMN